ncbi:MAG: zinc ribbon domain-containing protein [Gemmatimonadales bacterium]|nr:zinc ribbon domain-containing protein [Gemmatimonadales bacterium]
MGAEAIAAVLVMIALLWLIVQPMVLPGNTSEQPDDPPDMEETDRGRALLALREIEFDQATGKLSDDDFAELHARYTKAAVTAIEADPAGVTASDAIEGMIAARVATISDGANGFCEQCGARLPADAAFCAMCGAPARR